VPDDVPVVFSAHGVPKAVPAKAAERGLNFLDATCPLVSKVHRQAERLVRNGHHILFIGHKGHPEVIGTFGQVPEGVMTLVETAEDAATVAPPAGRRLAYLSQTTLSVDDTAGIIARLRQRFPAIVAPGSDDICYATSNRQAAVKAIAARCDAMLVIGAPNSSNSLRLVEVAERCGVKARLIQRAADVDFAWLDGVRTLGITAGASAPEILVRELVETLAGRFAIVEREVESVTEDMIFKLPRSLVA
jgi:4-hydroxy-3-methylbut-2-enyl diphosphate reductase